MFVAMAIVGLVHQLIHEFTTVAPVLDNAPQIQVIDWITVAPDGSYTLTQIDAPVASFDAEIERLATLPQTVMAVPARTGVTTITVHETGEPPATYCTLADADANDDEIGWLGLNPDS